MRIIINAIFFSVLNLFSLSIFITFSPVMYDEVRFTQLFPHLLSIPLVNSGERSCTEINGEVREESMDSEIFHAPVDYSIYLPPCFAANPSDRYPVIYLLHGQTYNNEQWPRLGLADVVDELIMVKNIPPIIIIMPNDPEWRQPEESSFGRMLVEELIPHVDKTYPTRAERQYRAIGGLSRGASWALHLGLSDWKLFSRIGTHSLPVFSNDNDDIQAWLDAIPPNSTPRIYIDTGNQDPELNRARGIENLLSVRHVPHEWHLFTGTHEEPYWAAHLEKYLLWYACDWTVLLYN
jgi:enterochelin esterase-like enzyme